MAFEQTQNVDAMSDAANSNQIPRRLRDQAIAALVPFFIDGPENDVDEARLTAEGLLDDYHAATPKELQLAAQIAATGLAILACLRTAMAAKDLTLEQKLDFQEAAIALDRLSQKANKALDASRKQRAKNPAALTPENTNWDEGAFQKVINKALEKMTEANSRFEAYNATQQAAPDASATGTHAIGELPTAAPATSAPAVSTSRKSKLPFLSVEHMTSSVLARRAKH